jgi:hypothetical protein
MKKYYYYNGKKLPQATMFKIAVGHGHNKGPKLEQILKLPTPLNSVVKKEVTIIVNGFSKVFTWSNGEYKNGKQTDIDYLLSFKDLGNTKVEVI